MDRGLNTNQFPFIHEEFQTEILADQLIAASRRNPRFRTDPVAAIYSTWMELGKEISARMAAIRAEQRLPDSARQAGRHRGVVRQ